MTTILITTIVILLLPYLLIGWIAWKNRSTIKKGFLRKQTGQSLRDDITIKQVDENLLSDFED